MQLLESELDRRRNPPEPLRLGVTPPGGPAPSPTPSGRAGGGGRGEREDLRGLQRSPIPLPRGMSPADFDAAIRADAERQREAARAATEAERLAASLRDLRVKGVEDAITGLAEFAAGMRDGKDLLQQFAIDLARDLPAILTGGTASSGVGALASAVIGPTAKAGSEWLSKALTSLIGFSSGGSFDVGSDTTLGLPAQGGDDRLVAFRARMGERVTVTPPGAAPAGPSFAVSIFVDGDATERTVERLRGVVREELVRAEPRLTARAVQASGREMTLNPDFGR
jgi:hypothetical protein